jgi:hypothetical protein
MPLPTTVQQYPSTLGYTFGVTTPETGITSETIEQNDQIDTYEQKNEFGETIEVVTYNPRSEITISGESTAALVAILGKSLTLANLITTQVGAGGLTVVKGVQYPRLCRVCLIKSL